MKVHRKQAACSCFIALLALAGTTLAAVTRVRFDVVDAKDQTPLAASVTLTDDQGHHLEIEGEHGHIAYLGKRWCYVDKTFALNTDRPRLIVEVRRGLETLPLKQTIEIVPEKSQNVTLALERWIDLKAEGYLSGDSHIHYMSTRDVMLQMRAEDLNVANLLVAFSKDAGPFTGQLDPESVPGHWLYVGQEWFDWQMGHTVLMRLKSLIQPVGRTGGDHWERHQPHMLLAPALREARQQGAVVAMAHWENLSGAESPIDIALGLIDAVELLTYDDPTLLPAHWDQWQNSGMSIAEFPPLRGLDLYYQYLNVGFRLPIAAGTDKMGDNIPVGSNRLYARVGEHAGYDGWLEGLKAGNGFITNGPILRFDVEGHVPGEVVPIEQPHRARARVSVRSLYPFPTLEIVMNGRVVASKWTAKLAELATEKDWETPPNGVFEMELSTEVDLDKSCWLAARVAEDTAWKRRIMPRGLTVFAHTNPVYFSVKGQKLRDPHAVRYLETYLRGTMHFLRNGARFEKAAEREEALRLAEEALRIIQRDH
ncbi:MAG: hypothetical protein A3G75_02940 [Verrucomicrobia bacterium RIFCSPLOWO2_12_FULL_64_8]|nr:MAG: hypothetical protein A3G75_02940 [Verrucomicrobia bacterium RIFCSPLOWO2_12_FULL_64_8]